MGELVLYGKGGGGKRKGPVDRQDVTRICKTVDYGSNVVRWLEESLARNLGPPRLQPHYSFTKELMPPFATPLNPYDAICCRFVYAAINKNRAPVNVLHWFPNGRRLLSGSHTGEITIWNGQNFQFENIMQAHNSAVKAMEWNPAETVLVTGDQLGVIKFWDPNLYNFQTFQAHKDSMCDISISPTGLKFCSCAEDSHAKVWDLRTGEEERAFTGHGWDVKSCSWHPTKGLVATGSKDAQIKLWDPRAGEAITTIFCHKNTVTRVKWSPSGQYLASASKDQLVMLMDIRTMSVRKVFKAHKKEVTSLCWHPETDSLLASGGYDSDLHFWDTQGSDKPIKSILGAHEGPIWSLAWHPLGHLLASGSHDYSTRFWSRARPGDKNFDDILPKKIAAPGDIPAGAIPPPPAVSTAVLSAGIFAGEPPKVPPESCPVMEGAKTPASVLARLALDNEPAKPMGFSIGEGGIKGILDTADFDELDGGAAPPVMSPPSMTPPPAKADEKTTAASAGVAKASPSPETPGLKPFVKAGAPAPGDAPAAATPAKVETEVKADDSGGTKREAPTAEVDESKEVDAKKARVAAGAEGDDVDV